MLSLPRLLIILIRSRNHRHIVNSRLLNTYRATAAPQPVINLNIILLVKTRLIILLSALLSSVHARAIFIITSKLFIRT